LLILFLRNLFSAGLFPLVEMAIVISPFDITDGEIKELIGASSTKFVRIFFHSPAGA